MVLEKNYKEKLKSGIIGLCVADALGVPVEFTDRALLQANPVIDMRGYGTYNQPPGTWSDDTSMTLCLLDSLSGGLDYGGICGKFLSWISDAAYTAHGEVFDVGNTTRSALQRYADGTEPIMCGGSSEYDNGNGSLMRILPLVFYLRSSFMDWVSRCDDIFEVIHNVSSLTHAHPRSHIACGIYLSIANRLFDDADRITATHEGVAYSEKYYSGKNKYASELFYFKRIFDDEFVNLTQESIKSSGYVVDSLEAALWCFMTTDNYKDCVLKAVNLGEDTDTVAAISAGLAGLHYGYEAIPKKWVEQIAHLDFILNLCNK